MNEYLISTGYRFNKSDIPIIFTPMSNKEYSVSKKIGVLGGGQLGRMLIQETLNYAAEIHVMEKSSGPATDIADVFKIGDITNFEDVISFGKECDYITVEIENVNIEALYTLEKAGKTVYPQPRVLEIIKDKGLQKQFYADNGIPTSSFMDSSEIESKDELVGRIPFVAKLRTGGYDGRGVQVIKSEEDLNTIFDAPFIAESFVPFVKELSVIVARNESGETAVYPTVECEFNDVNLVEFLFSPAEINEEIEKKARNLAIDVINKFEMVGIMAVEMFLTAEGDILVNEVAPRPHNSGHHTIECNVTSQFEQHFRSIVNLPLGSTRMVQHGAMLNLLGAENHEGIAKYNGLHKLTKYPGVHLHLYGKKQTKPHRKMGHITVTGDQIESVKQTAEEIKEIVSVTA